MDMDIDMDINMGVVVGESQRHISYAATAGKANVATQAILRTTSSALTA